MGPRPFPALTCIALTLFLTVASQSAPRSQEERLHGAFRNPQKDGWIFVHLEGAPSDIGFQHGYLLRPEIESAKRAVELSVTHEVNHSWTELRAVTEKLFWPKVSDEYRQELEGIAGGLKAQGSHLDVIDLLTMNAWMELPYYYDKSRQREAKGVPASVPEHCSAFTCYGVR